MDLCNYPHHTPLSQDECTELSAYANKFFKPIILQSLDHQFSSSEKKYFYRILLAIQRQLPNVSITSGQQYIFIMLSEIILINQERRAQDLPPLKVKP